MTIRPLTAASFVWLAAGACFITPPAMAGGKAAGRVQPLPDFLAAVGAARFHPGAADAEKTTRDAAAFAEMKDYILRRYEHIDAARVRSFADAAGAVFDCLPQPESGPAPPDAPASAEKRAPGRLARQNPSASCPPGAIPVQRITLETLLRFGSLRAFFRK